MKKKSIKDTYIKMTLWLCNTRFVSIKYIPLWFIEMFTKRADMRRTVDRLKGCTVVGARRLGVDSTGSKVGMGRACTPTEINVINTRTLCFLSLIISAYPGSVRRIWCKQNAVWAVNQQVP